MMDRTCSIHNYGPAYYAYFLPIMLCCSAQIFDLLCAICDQIWEKGSYTRIRFLNFEEA